MAPTKTIQRKVEKFGIYRFSKASGTHRDTVWRDMGEMLDQLIDADCFYIVHALHRGQISMPVAYAAWKKNGSRGITDLLLNRDIDLSAFQTFADQQDWSERTRKDHLYNFSVILKHAGANERLTDLPEVLRRYRGEVLAKSENGKSTRTGRTLFNYVRRTALQWIGFTQGKNSDSYQEILRKVKALKGLSKARRKYLSPSDVQKIIGRMPERAGGMFWTMATTGAGPKELIEDGISEREGGLFINGKKSKYRKRLVPLVYPPANVCLGYSGLVYHLKLAIAGTPYAGNVNIYDFRRSYPRWLMKAGIGYDRFEQYQGHKDQTMTDRYLFSDVTEFLRSDALQIRDWIERELDVEARPSQLRQTTAVALLTAGVA